MHDPQRILDRQLSGVQWTQGDRRAVLCKIGKEKPIMKRKLVTLLAAALLMMLLTGAAVAATVLWGVEDFADRRGDQLPDVPVQTGIPQNGGVGSEVTLFGYDGKGNFLSSQEVARLCDDEGCGLTAALGSRVARVYL